LKRAKLINKTHNENICEQCKNLQKEIIELGIDNFLSKYISNIHIFTVLKSYMCYKRKQP